MIHEIFIANTKNKVLYGDIAQYPECPVYPIHLAGRRRLSQLKTNDVVLSILHENLDSFTAAKCLRDLKILLEDRIIELNEKSVKENYFLIADALQEKTILSSDKQKPGLRLPGPENIYIDVVETIHTILSKDGRVLQNQIYGSILLNKAYEGDLRLAVGKGQRHHVVCKSPYELASQENSVEISAQDISSSLVLMTYSVQKAKDIVLKIKRNGDSLELSCKGSRHFKFVKVEIPVPETTFSAKIWTTAGKGDFKSDESIVEWNITDHKIVRESISIEKSLLEERADGRPIRIFFSAPGWSGSGLSVDECSSIENIAAKFWVNYTTQDGYFEIQQ